jgi:hypothetical protein
LGPTPKNATFNLASSGAVANSRGSRLCAASLRAALRPGHEISAADEISVPRMLRSVPHLRHGALLIRGPQDRLI